MADSNIYGSTHVVDQSERYAGRQVLVNLARALNDMSIDSKDDPRTKWNDTIEIALLGNRLDTLEPKDIFAAVREQFPDSTKIMQLNNRQSQAIKGARTAPGGMVVIQGGPGTGKSSMLQQMAKPFMRAEELHTILVASPSNASAIDLAAGTDSVLLALQKERLAPEGRYIVRLQPGAYERPIRDPLAGRFRLPAAHLYCLPQDFNRFNFDQIGHEMAPLFEGQTETESEGIPERRVNYLRYSVERRMLEIAGTIVGPSTHSDVQKFATFRQAFCQYVRGQDVLIDQFWIDTEELWIYTLQHASVIIGNTAEVGMHYVISNILTNVRVIMIDNAARQGEDHLLPLFAAPWKSIDGFVQAGDCMQTRPLVDPNLPASSFVRQFKLSFMFRLIKNGFPVIELRFQYRMVEDIARLANVMTYRDTLLNAESAQLSQRELARAFRVSSATLWGKDSNIILVDVVESKANQTKTGQDLSRYNDLFVILGASMSRRLLELHPQAQVAILTGYTAQRRRYMRVRDHWLDDKVLAAERWHIETFESCQGRQYDFVITDILISAKTKKLGIHSDRPRMNVTLTRAKHGQIVIASISAIEACPGGDCGHLARMLGHLEEYRCRTVTYDQLPVQEWYQP